MNDKTVLTDLLSRDEIRQFTQRSDLMGAWAVAFTWGVIALTFALLAVLLPQLPVWGQGVALVVALFVLAGRQLALGILTHDAAHSSLFARQWLNDHVADWLCARPVWNHLANYRAYHLRHHAKTGTPEDPDLCLVAGLPTTRRSLLRKFARDLLGITGLKFVIGRLLMDAGVLKWSVTSDVERILYVNTRRFWHYLFDLAKNSAPTLLMNGLLWGALAATGHGALYALWLLAYVTPFPLLIRIRSMAEHAGTENSRDVLRNTRTTQAGFVARVGGTDSGQFSY